MDYLNHPAVAELLASVAREDLGDGDHTTLATIPAHSHSTAVCRIKQAGVLAGVALAQHLFTKVDSSIKFSGQLRDGARVEPGDVAFEVAGATRTILSWERTVLNVMQRMSGVATLTRQVVDALAGTDCRVLDTRKTTPGFRHFEKWGVSIGGGTNHRYGLFDQILIKDNHIDACGGIIPALEAAQQYCQQTNRQLDIEIETRTPDEVRQAVETGIPFRILLDNMPLGMMRECVELIGGRAQTEASGNITRQNARQVAETGVDFLSMGALTHSYTSLDISLKIVR